MKESSRVKVNEKLSEASNISSPGRHISSISEAQEDRPTSKNIDIKSSSASHKNEALFNESKSQPAKSSPVTLRRTGSHGRLTNLYGSSKFFTNINQSFFVKMQLVNQLVKVSSKTYCFTFHYTLFF